MLKIFNVGGCQPRRGTPGSAGLDLFSNVDLTINPGERSLVDVGIKVAIGRGYYGRIASRSSMACKGIDVAAGVIDSDYRGVVKVLLVNNSREPFSVRQRDAIAQLIVEKIYTCEPEFVDTESNLGDTERGSGGFGSTNSSF